jgi:hypothetical protein
MLRENAFDPVTCGLRKLGLAGCILALVVMSGIAPVQAQQTPTDGYVGLQVCQPCHLPEYQRFTSYSKKNQSFQSIVRMKKGLTEDEIRQCYACHTTGYGRPGGFISLEQTPDLKEAGCEVCHGPGKLHSQTQDPSHIRGKPNLEVCRQCHIEERIRAFHYRPMLHGGAH